MSDKPIHSDEGNETGGIPSLVVFRCKSSHTFFCQHETCPICETPLEPVESPPAAKLVSHTTVRIGPTGSPFNLGLARVENGAQTLCIIEGDAEEAGTSEVVVYKKGGLYYAALKTRPRA